MRLRIITLILLFISISGFTVQADDRPVATFDKTVVDFGKFTTDNSIQQAIFTIHNTGTAPLVIVSVRTTCGCTAADYTKLPIMPGKSGTIKIVYDGRNSSIGQFSKSIFVRTNVSKKNYTLKISGNIQSSKRD